MAEPVAETMERWFASPPRPTCATHERPAENVCTRCGTFQCEACVTPKERSLCHACAVTVTDRELPALSRRAAWKLLLLPLVGFGCLLALASKGTTVRTLTSEQIGFLCAWLVPFGCGLALVRLPNAALAFLGSLVAVTLVLVVLGPALVADFTGQRVLDLVILVAGPIAAVRDAFAIDRTHRRRRLLASMIAA